MPDPVCVRARGAANGDRPPRDPKGSGATRAGRPRPQCAGGRPLADPLPGRPQGPQRVVNSPQPRGGARRAEAKQEGGERGTGKGSEAKQKGARAADGREPYSDGGGRIHSYPCGWGMFNLCRMGGPISN